MSDDLRNRIALIPVGHNPVHGKWRTEAMRSHASPRLLYLGKGQGRITVAGLTSGYGPNNLIFIPAHVMYGFETGPSVFGQLLTIPAAMAGDWPEEPVHLRLKDVVAQKEIIQILDALDRELTSGRAGHQRAALYHAGLLAVYFDRQITAAGAAGADSPDRRGDSAAARLVAAYTDLIERDYRTGLGVAGFAAALGVTPTHLTRSCRTTSGRSALGLLNDRILYEARVLLRETRRPVQEIARDLGFGSAAYFTRSFQLRAGMTPSEFRRKGLSPLH